MATFTASQWTSSGQPKAGHTGVQCAIGNLVAVGVTGTASSVMYMVQVPVGCTIVDWMWSGEDLAADQTYKLGLRMPISDTWTLTESALAGDLSFTAGQTHRATNVKLPYKVSASSNAITQWAWVQAVAKIAISASASHKLSVFYAMDTGG